MYTRKRFVFGVVLWALLMALMGLSGVVGVGVAWACPPTQGLPENIERARQRSGIALEELGIYIQALDQVNTQSNAQSDTSPDVPPPCLSINAHKPFKMASLMKLYTSLMALEVLGPAKRWQSDIRTHGHARNGVLQDDVYFNTHADPALTIEELWRLFKQVRAQGIHTLQGDVVINNTWFELPNGHDQPFDDRPWRPYNVSAHPAIMNFNAVGVHLLPKGGAKDKQDEQSQQGQQVVAWLEPQPKGWTVEAQVKLSTGSCQRDERRLQLNTRVRPHSVHITVRGTLARACGLVGRYVSPVAHERFTTDVLRALWHDLGGTWQGQVRFGATPTAARVLAQLKSQPLAVLVRDMNKFSNNQMARQLFFQLPQGQRPVTLAQARRVAKQWVRARGLDAPALRFDNGSGLSKEAVSTPALLAQLLGYGFKGTYMPEWMASLPLMGQDGTLRYHDRWPQLTGRAYLKTGSLEQVRAMAGFVQARSGRRYAVVLVVNSVRVHRAQDLFGALLSWLALRY